MLAERVGRIHELAHLLGECHHPRRQRLEGLILRRRGDDGLVVEQRHLVEDKAEDANHVVDILGISRLGRDPVEIARDLVEEGSAVCDAMLVQQFRKQGPGGRHGCVRVGNTTHERDQLDNNRRPSAWSAITCC